MFPDYQISARNKNGEELGVFTQIRNLDFTHRLNNYGSCSFQTPVTNEELTTLVGLRQLETVVKRNGSIVWAGEQADRNGTLERNSANWLQLISFTFFEMLNAMYSEQFVRYENTDEGEILKGLVDTFQAKTNGDLGFTFGQYQTGTNRDREYESYNVMEAFINMSKLINGPDFYITSEKQINIVPHRGVDKSRQIIFEWGTNIETVSIDENFVTPANEAIVLGAGFGSEQVIGTHTDTSLGNIYGLRQQRSSETDVSIQNTLEAKAEALVQKYGQLLRTIEVTQLPGTVPNFGVVTIGDTVRVRIREGIFNIDNNVRIYERRVSIGPSGEEKITYLFGEI